MKRLKNALIGVGVIAGILGFTMPVFAASHADQAAAYEQKAADLDTVIAEHTAMKKEGMTGKTPMSTKQKMEKHCDAVIAASAKVRDEYRSFATWHKMQGKEEKVK